MELTTEDRFSKMQLPKILEEGYCVGQENWADDEYIYSDEGELKNEEGESCSLSEFTGNEYEREGAWKIVEIEEEEEEAALSFEDALELMGERPSGGNRKLSDEQLEQIIALKNYGYTYKQIAPKFGMTEKNTTSLGQMVKKYLKRKEE